MIRRLVAIAVVSALATPAAGSGPSGLAQLHPGAMGYARSERTGGGVPTAHQYPCESTGSGDDGCPATFVYPLGPGGWGGWVSSAVAECGGMPGVHEPDCDPNPF